MEEFFPALKGHWEARARLYQSGIGVTDTESEEAHPLLGSSLPAPFTDRTEEDQISTRRMPNLLRVCDSDPRFYRL